MYIITFVLHFLLFVSVPARVVLSDRGYDGDSEPDEQPIGGLGLF